MTACAWLLLGLAIAGTAFGLWQWGARRRTLRRLNDMLDRAIAGLSLAREGRGEARKQELEQVRDGLQNMKKEWDGWQR